MAHKESVRRSSLAVGGRGGRRIPNAVFEVLTAYVSRQASVEETVKTPRLHTEGDLRLTLERGWPEADVKYLQKIGYKVAQGASAVIHAVARDAKTGETHSAGW